LYELSSHTTFLPFLLGRILFACWPQNVARLYSQNPLSGGPPSICSAGVLVPQRYVVPLLLEVTALFSFFTNFQPPPHQRLFPFPPDWFLLFPFPLGSFAYTVNSQVFLVLPYFFDSASRLTTMCPSPHIMRPHPLLLGHSRSFLLFEDYINRVSLPLMALLFMFFVRLPYLRVFVSFSFFLSSSRLM